MSGGTYKMIKLVGTSPESFSQAVKTAVSKASQTLKGIGWFQVVEQRGFVNEGGVQEFQVVVEVGFKLLDDADD